MSIETAVELTGRLRQQLLTQDGRCTADPFFVVFSKRPIVVDEDYDHDRIVWCREDDCEVEATESQHRRLEALHRAYRKPDGWRRLAIKEIDHFETACFTEQGCKDFLAIQGHNLSNPFIYAHSLFRNREMLELRKLLMEEPKPGLELTIENAPIGTLAPAIMGGRWYRTEHGWKWNGPDGSGGTFPRPGGDWTGDLIPPDQEGGAA